jgi:DNA-binding NarL/FixJ family response regulator
LTVKKISCLLRVNQSSSTETIMRPLHLLLLDDHPITLAGLAAELNDDAAFTVAHQCRSLKEAMQAFALTSIDVVITDFHLADGTTGLDLLTQMRQLNHTAPVLMLSSDDRTATVRQALGLGVAGYLSKYSEVQAIKQAVAWVVQPQNREQVYLWPSSLRRALTAEPAFGVAQSSPAALSKLSPREKEVLRLFGQGAEPKEIAASFVPVLSVQTVYSHLTKVRQKLNIQNEVELRSYGLRYLSSAEPTSAQTGSETSVRRPPSGRLVTNNVPLN